MSDEDFVPVGREPSLPSQFSSDDIKHERAFNAMLELFDSGKEPHGIETRTDLTDIEILHLSRGRFLAAYFNRGAADAWIQTILRMKLSRHRGSRKEAVDVMKHALPQPDIEATGILARLRR